ncbi:zf-TFIIB domain-containing protein [Microbulbifer sp. ALW1]|uniref:TFIIB-type zinc ribbon-containing protein n=1 Tax=Microbulbifer sp. (strain ALW1) TaxID=1516059 RepID=UPI0013590463|nr:zf-TFIIB domain-containing protein [Microbulbifer sp. ALW1]
MHCPKCRHEYLKPTRFEEGLPVMGCPKCEGALLSLLHYRDWSERVNLDSGEEPAQAEISSDTDTKTAISCPKCSRLMAKYSVSGSLDTRLDLCGNCDEAWLDGGEWQLLKSLELGNQVPSVFTEQWQRKVRSEKTELNRINRLKKVVGESDTERALEIKTWLKDNKNKATILHFLGTD